MRNEAPAVKDWAEFVEYRKRKQRLQQEVFQLERELRAAREGWAEGEPVTGTLPDFVVIGAAKSGTTFFYHLLSQHPLVEPCAKKELHYFDMFFDEGVEWYRRCFPTPTWKDGRRTITGEATPYLAHPFAPERMTKVVPHARLIALLRNPVDRAYSHYWAASRKGNEVRTFEEAIDFEGVQLLGKEGGIPEREDCDDGLNDDSEYLSMGVYADQLLRWSGFFAREQMLVLKSEDYFEDPAEFFEPVLGFLGLPHWKPEEEALGGRLNAGRYEGGMDQATRRRLEEYFAPHNEMLYDYLGRDLGW